MYYYKEDYDKAEDYLEKSLSIHKELGIEHFPIFMITTYLCLIYRNRGKSYDIEELHRLIKEQKKIEFEFNYCLYQLLEVKSYLETAYNQIQELADNLEPEVKAKFLSYPIPKAIIEEWEKVK